MQSLQGFHDLIVTNKSGFQDKFIEYWDEVAKRFSGNEYVVGYDPLNEPFPGDPTREFMNLYPGYFEGKYLQPLYAKLFERY